MIDIPVPLKALQIARHMMGFDPLWTEGILSVQNRVAQLLAEHTDYYGAWIPIRIIDHAGFIRVEENGIAGEYRASCDPLNDHILDIEPLSIHPHAPSTLQHMLQIQLEAWPVEAEQLELKTLVQQLADSAFIPYTPKIKDALLVRFESISINSIERSDLLTKAIKNISMMRPYIDTLLRNSSEAFYQLRLCGRQMAIVLAFTTLVNVLLEKIETQDKSVDDYWIAQAEFALHRAFYSTALSCSETMLNTFLHSLASLGHLSLVIACVEQFESYTNQAFENAKSVGLSTEVSEENVVAHVCNDFGYALTLWSDMHQALKMLLPAAYAGQLLARFLCEYKHADLANAQTEKIRFIYKQCDETVVIIMTSLSHAVRAHDPKVRASHIALIREARKKRGEREARAIIRNLVEQQAFYPRAWKKWLEQVSKDVELKI
ncbi:MAG: hypothetical protein V4525_05615 [Pseudomonadota bacterium]